MTLEEIIYYERKEAVEEVKARQLIFYITNMMKNLHLDLSAACEGLGVTEEDYNKAKELLEESLEN